MYGTLRFLIIAYSKTSSSLYIDDQGWKMRDKKGKTPSNRHINRRDDRLGINIFYCFYDTEL